MEIGDDHLHGHVGLVDLPAVVVGDHGHRGVGDLGLAGALGLAEVGHADHVVPIAVIGQRFGAGAEGGALHVHVGAAVVHPSLLGLGRLEQQLAQLVANGVGEGDVGHDAPAEEGMLRRALGAVDELVHQHDVAGLELGLQRADGADADDPLHAELLHRPEVGPVVQFSWQDPVSAPVTGQEDHLAAGQFACEEGVGRIAEGSLHLHPLLTGEAFDGIETAAADDADAMGSHGKGDAVREQGIGSGFPLRELSVPEHRIDAPGRPVDRLALRFAWRPVCPRRGLPSHRCG